MSTPVSLMVVPCKSAPPRRADIMTQPSPRARHVAYAGLFIAACAMYAVPTHVPCMLSPPMCHVYMLSPPMCHVCCPHHCKLSLTHPRPPAMHIRHRLPRRQATWGPPAPPTTSTWGLPPRAGHLPPRVGPRKTWCLSEMAGRCSVVVGARPGGHPLLALLRGRI